MVLLDHLKQVNRGDEIPLAPQGDLINHKGGQTELFKASDILKAKYDNIDDSANERGWTEGHILIPQFSSNSNNYVVKDGIVSYKVLLTDTGEHHLFDRSFTQTYLQSKTLEEILEENSLYIEPQGEYKDKEKYAYFIRSPFAGEKGSKIHISGIVRLSLIHI